MLCADMDPSPKTKGLGKRIRFPSPFAFLSDALQRAVIVLRAILPTSGSIPL
jgi:hypothetical protein